MTHPRRELAVVVLNHNSGGDLLGCLSALQQSGIPSKDLIVVDNASSDDSLDRAQAAYPHADFCPTGANNGFTGGNNHGIARAVARGYRLVLLVNPDCPVNLQAITAMLEAARSLPDAAIIAPAVYSDLRLTHLTYGGTSDVAADSFFSWFRKNFLFWWAPRVNSEMEGIIQVHCFVGCCFLINLDQLALNVRFDENLFVHGSEHELNLRLVRMAKPVYFSPKAKVYHRGGLTSFRSNDSITKDCASIWYAAQKNQPRSVFALFSVYFALRNVAAAVRDLAYFRQFTMGARWRGMLVGLRQRSMP